GAAERAGGGGFVSVFRGVSRAVCALAGVILFLTACAEPERKARPTFLQPHPTAVRWLPDSDEAPTDTVFSEPERFGERCINDGRIDLCVWFSVGSYELLLRNPGDEELVIDWSRGRFLAPEDEEAKLATCTRGADNPAVRRGVLDAVDRLPPGYSLMMDVVPDRGSGCDNQYRDAFGYPRGEAPETLQLRQGMEVALTMPFQLADERGVYELRFVLLEAPL
ncbi:MAG: hypothetical protein LC732_04740, partial [Acidobacteria bacterium]|nr:hypothetical protein [Acidobacteriota bacterium]